jgi:hypothetical protein
MKRTEPQIIEVTPECLEGIFALIEKVAGEPFYETLKAIVESYVYLNRILEKKEASIGRLQKMLFGSSTEKTKAVTGTSQGESSSEGEAPTESARESAGDEEPPKKRKGHGRNGASAHRGAKRVPVPHLDLQAGDPCPKCLEGTLYEQPPSVLVRLVGQAPVQSTLYELERLRCHLCGAIFTAPAPQEAPPTKYDATVGSMIGVLKYGSGMPFNRLQRLQGSLGIPLAASTQWDVLARILPGIEPVHVALIRLAAQGELFHNDDTTAKILAMMGKRKEKNQTNEDDQPDDSTDPIDPSRTGMYTSGIVSIQGDRKVVLFFTGRRHAGENLKEVLRKRAAELDAPIQMCDALSRNLPGELETIVANCLAHGRRRFADVAAHFPDPCKYVLEMLSVVYKNDAFARQQELSPKDRLTLHQRESGPVLEELHQWLDRQLDDRLVEPSSGLGESIRYMLNHWDKLTLFLRKAGAPLDNNICERALKKAILHRKNSLFFRSERGAHTADVFMSLIYTCELCGANPFEYLTELQRHTKEVAATPEKWMPWNYRENLDAPSA